MGRIRGWVKKLERASREDLASFELLDASRYYYDPTSWELFMHWHDCAVQDTAHDWPEAPEVIRKLCEAKDPEAALEQVMSTAGFGGLVYDPEVLITERRLEPRGLISRYDPRLGRHVVLDPYDSRVEDLSEQAKDARNSS